MSKALIAAAAILMTVAMTNASAQDSPGRKELKRADLSGAPGMEVILSTGEYKPGDKVDLHFHHGVEAAYVLEGAMIQVPGKDPTELKTGTAIMNLRDIPHAGWTVVGEKALKLVTVHVVDKGKPLYDSARK